MTTPSSLQSIRDRFEAVNNLIIEHPNFDDETRSIAAIRSIMCMCAFTNIIKNCDGRITQEVMPALDDVFEFLDFVENHCAVE